MAVGIEFDGHELELLMCLAQKAWFDKHTMVSREELAQEVTLRHLPKIEESDISGLLGKGLIEEPVKGVFSVTAAGMSAAKNCGFLG
ncbi:hypothetical protein [Xanthobacter aminoxidans]|uniref:hypothetical protein n=1 Tax=Xanthobacter aminoxidans TaxID=186280 RepID=UPI002023179E|nr:hypothetical protein [Xanthobacter aminoxidans]MCL8382124.1 hypothetical protein [Xanthobacter aminoxidans]